MNNKNLPIHQAGQQQAWYDIRQLLELFNDPESRSKSPNFTNYLET